MKGVTKFEDHQDWNGMVSIHTPNEGSDYFTGYYKGIWYVFQSTLPMKGVTWVAEILKFKPQGVSIHTPNEGSDIPSQVTDVLGHMFQSTLPMKGVTPVRA